MDAKTKRQVKIPLKFDFTGGDPESLKNSLANRLEYTAGKDTITATSRDWFNVCAHVARDRCMERWMQTMRSYYNVDTKRVYYLSMEFLMGRTLSNSLLNLGIYDALRDILNESGLDFEDICAMESDAALGNGGLGRLAACFLDSMASIGIPGYGYGIRYEYGMFNQRVENGHQVEHPDNWLRYGNPWEFPRAEVLYPVKFHGRVVEHPDERGHMRYHWVDTDDVMAMAYDTPIPGYRTNTVNNMRLWAAKSSRDFDLKYFNQGNYIKAVEDKNSSENISKVLYPDDTTTMGKELRLKQQYFFVCASLQDILHRYNKFHDSFDELPDKVAIQLNDTHPTIGVAELMRILVDIHHLDWERAWGITVRTFAYTNHTLMPEALETWPVSIFEDLLPRHLQIIYEINHRFLKDIMHRSPGDKELLRRMSVISEEGERSIRMAHLAIVGSHKVNGVSKIHTELMRHTIFADFYQFFPEKFINITNGITQRRWLNQANPGLSKLITSRIGDGWLGDMEMLKALAPYADDPEFLDAFRRVKRENKIRLAGLIRERLGITVYPESLFDVQIKRMHEYKRQLLNVLHIITLYNRLRANPHSGTVPRTMIFAGKAAPGYYMAKLVIKLINDVADIVNNDPAVGSHLKVVFIPNYDVSTAQDIIPAADLSEQISTAGTEASGTGNMKLALNGALTIGTLDGANIEIHEQVGEDNIFIFGLTTQEIRELTDSGYDPMGYYHSHQELRQALDMIGSGYFSPDRPELYRPLIESLTGNDPFLLLADYGSYVECQQRVADLYLKPDEWARRAILNVAHMGYFSSDRTIREYAKKIWDVKPVPIRIAGAGKKDA